MCANCGPAGYNYDETLSTLRYANRAKNIRNKPKINEDPKDAMLREFQEEIARLKAQIASGEGGGGGGGGGYGAAEAKATVRKEVVEVEKKVIVEKVKEVVVGLSKEDMQQIQAQMADEKRRMQERAEAQMSELMDQAKTTDEERELLREQLADEEDARAEAVETQRTLKGKLKAMENKLIQGGKMLDEAARQEAELRRTEAELEEKKEQEKQLAVELAKKEEANFALEEKYGSLQEEVDVKTRKLQKLHAKLQSVEKEVETMKAEFQNEKEEMLDAVRQLTRQIKLKEVITANFVPPGDAKKIEARAVWDDDAETYSLRPKEAAPARVKRPISAPGLRRPETEYARHRKQYDPNPRYKYDNIVALELDAAERTTQDFDGPQMLSRVQQVLELSINASEVEVTFGDPASEVGPGGGGGDAKPDGGADDAKRDDDDDARRERRRRDKEGAADGDERREVGAKDEKDRSRDRPKSSRPSTARRRREKEGVIAP